MKHIAHSVRPFVVVAILLVTTCCVAFAQRRAVADDSISVSLLTCEPGQKVYSLYGHTAIRYRDLKTGEDWTFNYGVFNFNKPHFVLRFVFGLTDYELGVLPMDIFQKEYEHEGRKVWEQVLNMTTEEKLRLKETLAINYMPENRIYRYNYFYDNCTTRARDMIEQAFGGKLSYVHGDTACLPSEPSYRQLIHSYTANYPWAQVGNDICLGCKADMATDWRERQFLPMEMMGDLEGATVTDSGRTMPAVLLTQTVVEGRQQTVEKGGGVSPTICAALLLVLTVIVSLAEWKSGRWLRFYDVLLMTVQGLAGVVILALLFSQHPTTSTNLQALLLNPLPLLFVYSVVRGRPTRWWRVSAVLSVLFFIGMVAQCYAEGMVLVSLSLLLRSVVNELRQRRQKSKNINVRVH